MFCVSSWFQQLTFIFSTYVKVLFHEDGSVKGIATNDVGIAKDGSPKVLQNKVFNNTAWLDTLGILYNILVKEYTINASILGVLLQTLKWQKKQQQHRHLFRGSMYRTFKKLIFDLCGCTSFVWQWVCSKAQINMVTPPHTVTERAKQTHQHNLLI